MGEAFNWPCAIGIVRRLIPQESRSLANAIFHGGGSIGAVITPALVLVMAVLAALPVGENWRLVFQVVGVLGLAWNHDQGREGGREQPGEGIHHWIASEGVSPSYPLEPWVKPKVGGMPLWTLSEGRTIQEVRGILALFLTP